MFRWHKTFLLDNGWCQGNLSFPGFGIFYDQKPFGLSDLEKGQFPLGQLVVSRSCWPDLQMVGFGWPMYLTWSHGVRRTFFCLNRLEKKIHLDSSVDSLRVIRLVFAIYFEWMGTVDVYRHFFFRRHETICAFAGQGVLWQSFCVKWVVAFCGWSPVHLMGMYLGMPGCRHPANFNQSPTLVYFS